MSSARDSLSNNFNLIRLFAAMQVLVVHSLNHHGVTEWWVLPLKAFPGVPVFFFISGYLISGSYLRAGPGNVYPFFYNRCLRIYPALWLCVVLSLVAIWFTDYFTVKAIPASEIAPWTIAQMSLFQFYNPDFMRDFGVGVFNGALWTITVELQFYLLTPIVVWMVSSQRWLAALLFAVSIVANVYLGWFDTERTTLHKLAYVSFLPWIYMFMLGTFVAFSPRLKKLMLSQSLLLAIVLYLSSMFLIGGYVRNAQNAINPISVAFLTIILMIVAHKTIRVMEGFQAFVAESDLSYGIYLYHMPVINLTLFYGLSAAVSFPIIFFSAILLGMASWFGLEAETLRGKKLYRRPTSSVER